LPCKLVPDRRGQRPLQNTCICAYLVKLRPTSRRTRLMAGELDAPFSELPECHCLAMRQAARHVTRFYDDVLAASGLRTTQFSILARLHRLGPMTINALADALVLDRTTLGRNILPLQRDGLITTFRAGEDRRSKTVRVTRAGVTRLKAAAQLWGEAQACFEAAFGVPRLSALRALLDEPPLAGRRLGPGGGTSRPRRRARVVPRR
jgi:DNA-binding MarR family transcriptional regulator